MLRTSGTSVHVCARPSACLSLAKPMPRTLAVAVVGLIDVNSGRFLHFRPNGVYVVQPHIKDGGVEGRGRQSSGVQDPLLTEDGRKCHIKARNVLRQ